METARNTLSLDHFPLRVFLAAVLLSVLGAGASFACTCSTQKDTPTEDEVLTRHLDRGRPALQAEVIYSETYRAGQRPGYSETRMRRYLFVVHKSWNSKRRSFWATTTTGTCGIFVRTAELVLLLPTKEGAPLALHTCGHQLLRAPDRHTAILGPPQQETAWTGERWNRFSASVQTSYSRLRPGCEGEIARTFVRARNSGLGDSLISLNSVGATRSSPEPSTPISFGALVRQGGADKGHPLRAEASLPADPRCWTIYTLTPTEPAGSETKSEETMVVLSGAPSTRASESVSVSWQRSRIAPGEEFEVVVERSPYGPFIQWPPN